MVSDEDLAFTDKYVKPARIKLEIWDPLGPATDKDPIYEFNAFSNSNDIILQDFNIQLPSPSNSGSFSLGINDSLDRAIDQDVLEDNVIVVKLGKTEDTLQNVMYGFLEDAPYERFGDTGLKYNLTGPGSGILLGYTLVKIVKQQPLPTLVTNILQDPIIDDPRFRACNLFREVFEDPEVCSIFGLSIKDRGKFTLNGIDENIQTIISNINQQHVTAATVLNGYAETTGSNYGIDEFNDAYFNHGHKGPANGIVLKDRYLVSERDDGNITSYIMDGYTTGNSIKSQDGFIQRLIAIATKSDTTGGSTSAVGSTSTYNQDLAVMRIPGPQRFKDLSFTFSKVGTGTDIDRPFDPNLTGFIITDNGSNSPDDDSTPINKVATFQIPITQIQSQPSPTQKLDIKFLVRDIEIDKPHWIVIQERGDSLENCIMWWHDNDFDTPNRYSAIRPLPTGRGQGGETNSPVGWVVSSKGPVYSHVFSTSSNIVNEASSDPSIQRWGGRGTRPKEARIDVQWAANDFQTMNAYLGARIAALSKKIRNFTMSKVTIPNTFFRPNTTVQLIDSLLRGYSKSRFRMLKVMGVTYRSAAGQSDNSNTPQGVTTCEIVPREFVSPNVFENK